LVDIKMKTLQVRQIAEIGNAAAQLVVIWCPGSAWTPAFAALPLSQKYTALPLGY
jgi:hypothetical protein